MRNILGMLLLGLAASQALAANPVQCWTDDKGQRACGNEVPPQYAKKQRDTFNNRGQVINVKPREKTAAERAEDQRKADAATAEKTRLDKQTAYDHYLLQTFDSVTQMQKMRDSRTSTLDARIKLGEKSTADTETTLAGLKARMEEVQKSGKPDAKLAKQIKDFETSLVDGLKGLADLKKEREETQTKFDHDIERFKKLKAGTLQLGAPD